MAGPSVVPPPCVECGACCFSPADDYVPVSDYDFERMGAEARELAVPLAGRVFMKMIDGHCAALVLEPEERRYVCSIYEERPSVCRSFARDAEACHNNVARKRETALLALVRGGPG